MNIDELTIKDLRSLQSLFGATSVDSGSKKSLYDQYIGKYVICRTRNEGINAGYVLELDDTGVILQEARRLWYHRPIDKNCSWYEGVARNGISESSKVGVARQKLIVEDYSLTLCSREAEQSIQEAPEHEQN